MVEDEYGFVYPSIDESKCIKCGLCLKTCVYKKKTKPNTIKDSYMAVSKIDDILMKSASGGIFTSIAQEILKNNGVVFGCSMEKDEQGRLEPQHIKVSSLDDLYKLQGSKYVQSNTKNIYKEIKNELKNNKLVLFSGTPCQVAALKSFLGKINQENLYTIDIICHGVPNFKMFQDYIEFIEEKNKDKVENFLFRDKSKSWGYFAKISFASKKVKFVPCINSSFYQLFLNSLINRENCYSCPYANGNRVGDLTIGDFWGIEKEHPNFLKENHLDSKKGISCIIVNNDKGKCIIEKFSGNILLKSSKFEKISIHNHQLVSPIKCNPKREIILNLYKNNGYKAVDKWYRNDNKINYIIKSLWYKMPYGIRKIIKK